MTDKFIKGEKLSPEKVATELLPILAMWGLSRKTARNAAWELWYKIKEMTDAEYENAAKGMKIKGGPPNNAKPQNQH